MSGIEETPSALGLNADQRETLRTHRLSERGFLIKVTAKRVNNTRPDADATGELCDKQKASKTAVRVSKTLIPKTYLSPVTTIYNQIRDITRHKLLAWDDTGWRLCPIGIYQEVRAELNAKKTELHEAIQLVVDNWDTMMKEIKQMGDSHLGKLFNPDDYPTAKEFQDMWDVEVSVQQIPSTDIRVVMDEASAADLEKQILQMVTANASKAWSQAANQLAQSVSHAAKILNDQGAPAKGETKAKRRSPVHDTLLSNLKVQVDTVKAMADAMGDTKLKKLALAVERDILQHDAETLRSNPAVRELVGKKATALSSQCNTEVVVNKANVSGMLDEMSDFTS